MKRITVLPDTYQKVMNYFTPKLWLGMTATPDKRDDNMEGRNIYEMFHHQIAYEIRLQAGNGRRSVVSISLFWNYRFGSLLQIEENLQKKG